MIKLSEKIDLENFSGKHTGILMDIIIRFCEEEGFEAIDLDDALTLLRTFSKNYSSDKFNIYPKEINSKDELLKLNTHIHEAIAGNKALISRICMNCRKRYYIFIAEKEFFELNDLALPKRCKDCRKKKYQERRMSQEEAHE